MLIAIIFIDKPKLDVADEFDIEYLDLLNKLNIRKFDSSRFRLCYFEASFFEYVLVSLGVMHFCLFLICLYKEVKDTNQTFIS